MEPPENIGAQLAPSSTERTPSMQTQAGSTVTSSGAPRKSPNPGNPQKYATGVLAFDYES